MNKGSADESGHAAEIGVDTARKSSLQHEEHHERLF